MKLLYSEDCHLCTMEHQKSTGLLSTLGQSPAFGVTDQVVLWGQAHTKAIRLCTSIQGVQRPPPHLARTAQWAFLGVFWGGVTESC